MYQRSHTEVSPHHPAQRWCFRADKTTQPADDGPNNELATAVHNHPTPATQVVAVAFATLVLMGCGQASGDRVKVYPVEGQITLDGRPLANAFVVLHPRNASTAGQLAARGQTDEKGRFELSTYVAQDGAAAGEYAVTVQYHKLIRAGDSLSPGPNVLSPRIANPESTDIRVRVAEHSNRLVPIEVRRK